MRINSGKLGLLAGAGLGATLMYFMDAAGGGRRRALVRDKSVKASRKTSEMVEGRAEDMRNRAKGVAAEARSHSRKARPTNHQLESRVRAELGHHVEHARAIDVVADGGRVILQGVALRDELDDVLNTVQNVNGVKAVVNNLDVRETPGNIPSLQS